VTTSSLRQISDTRKEFLHHRLSFEELKSHTLEGGFRLYENADGVLFPSVTTALGDMKRESLMEWRRRVGEAEANRIGREAASLGTRLHTMCENYLNNVLDYDRKAFPGELELFSKMRPVLDERISVVYAQEFPMYSLDLGVAGRCDCFCVFDGKPTVVDFKSSSKLKKEEWIENYFIQATAYCLMLRERFGRPIDKFAVLISSPEGMQVFHKDTEDYIEVARDYFKGYHARHGHTQEYFRGLIERNETCT
jgi:PD-(D/E)XK nuclease superfamily